MILLTQNGKNWVNFDNVTTMELNDDYNDESCIIVNFKNNTSLVIGRFKDKEDGRWVFKDLLMDYRGNAVIEVPKDKIKGRTAATETTSKKLNQL